MHIRPPPQVSRFDLGVRMGVAWVCLLLAWPLGFPLQVGQAASFTAAAGWLAYPLVSSAAACCAISGHRQPWQLLVLSLARSLAEVGLMLPTSHPQQPQVRQTDRQTSTRQTARGQPGSSRRAGGRQQGLTKACWLVWTAVVVVWSLLLPPSLHPLTPALLCC